VPDVPLRVLIDKQWFRLFRHTELMRQPTTAVGPVQRLTGLLSYNVNKSPFYKSGTACALAR